MTAPEPQRVEAAHATGSGPPPAAVIETHISVLFFVGERVYKLRKPVKFGFVDFERREDRRQDCEREVALNRRLAPDVYLGVAGVAMDGASLDHLVVMRRLPADRCLRDLLARRPADRSWVRPLVAVLARFHASAERSPAISAAGRPEVLLGRWEADFAECDAYVGTYLNSEREAEVRSLVREWIEGRSPLLEARLEEGRVCDGHGDLQADDIYYLDDGVRVLDCLEFADALRHGDVMADVAFLVMDLERLGHADGARAFLERYRELTADRVASSLVDHYVAARAYVRAKVACLRAEQGAGVAVEVAAQLHALAHRRLQRARSRLVLVGGLPGSGKSTVAAGAGLARGWQVLRSDVIRHDLDPRAVDATDGLFAGRYRPELTRRVYEALLTSAERSLGMGESVVLDASWVDPAFREAAVAVAGRTASALVEITCVADDDVADRRIEERLAARDDVSEATPAVRAALRSRQAPSSSAFILDTTDLEPDAAVTAALDLVDRATGNAGLA